VGVVARMIDAAYDLSRLSGLTFGPHTWRSKVEYTSDEQTLIQFLLQVHTCTYHTMQAQHVCCGLYSGVHTAYAYEIGTDTCKCRFKFRVHPHISWSGRSSHNSRGGSRGSVDCFVYILIAYRLSNRNATEKRCSTASFCNHMLFDQNFRLVLSNTPYWMQNGR
jgi:hypothetical protein